jgi:hypothetical protein
VSVSSVMVIVAIAPLLKMVAELGRRAGQLPLVAVSDGHGAASSTQEPRSQWQASTIFLTQVTFPAHYVAYISMRLVDRASIASWMRPGMAGGAT